MGNVKVKIKGNINIGGIRKIPVTLNDIEKYKVQVKSSSTSVR